MNSTEISSLKNQPKPIKRSTRLLDDHYNTPNTSLIVFQFEPASYASTVTRLEKSLIQYASIDEKDLYTWDHFFSEQEGDEMTAFGKQATFSRNSYGSPEAIEKGEKPAKSMNGKERWQLFANPPHAVYEVYKLFGLIAHKLNVEVTTLPWELCDRHGHGSSSFVVNLITEASYESMELGKHKDCNPLQGLSFGIPMLYQDPPKFHPKAFLNGAAGAPWLVSVMLYTTAEDFLPEYHMGTVFYKDNGTLALTTACKHMRLVLFEGDLFHSIEESKLPLGMETWRISHVFKLIFNPQRKDQSIKKEFFEWMKSTSPHLITLSLDTHQPA